MRSVSNHLWGPGASLRAPGGVQRDGAPEALRFEIFIFILFYFILFYLFIFFTSCDEAHLNGERFKKPLWNMIFFLNVDIKMK